MNPWICAFLIVLFGSLGGLINALLSDNGFLLPRVEDGVWCPGALSNILLGGFAAFGSWSFYGAGAGIELAKATAERSQISLTFSALAGALFVGIAGAKWITSEVDKRLLKESVKTASTKTRSPEECERLVQGSPRQVLKRVKYSPDEQLAAMSPQAQ
jgi:hypothetical protein